MLPLHSDDEPKKVRLTIHMILQLLACFCLCQFLFGFHSFLTFFHFDSVEYVIHGYKFLVSILALYISKGLIVQTGLVLMETCPLDID